MRWWRDLASQSGTHTTSTSGTSSQDTTPRGAVSSGTSYPPTFADYTMANRGTWSFQGIDMDNRIDDDGDIIIVGEKRDGVFQPLSAARHCKRDSSQVACKVDDSPAKKLKVDDQTLVEKPSPTNASARSTAEHDPAPKRAKPITFMVEDDSDTDADQSPPPPPSIRPQARWEPCSHDVRYRKLTPAQQEAARREHKRLWAITLERRRNKTRNGSKKVAFADSANVRHDSPLGHVTTNESESRRQGTDALALGSFLPPKMSVEGDLHTNASRGGGGRDSGGTAVSQSEETKLPQSTKDDRLERHSNDEVNTYLGTNISHKTNDQNEDQPPLNQYDGTICETVNSLSETASSRVMNSLPNWKLQTLEGKQSGARSHDSLRKKLEQVKAHGQAGEHSNHRDNHKFEEEVAWRAEKAVREAKVIVDRDKAAKTRKDAERKRADDWEKKQRQRQLDAQKKLDDAKKNEAAQREAMRKKHGDTQDVANLIDLQQSALAKLRAAKKPSAEKTEIAISPFPIQAQVATFTPMQEFAATAVNDNLTEKQLPGDLPSGTSPSGALHTKPQWAADREERICVQKERNARLQREEEQEEKDQQERAANVTVGVTANEPPKPVPRSLNSLAREMTVVCSNTPVIPCLEDRKTALEHDHNHSPLPQPLHKPKKEIRKIRPEDAKLLQWHNDEHLSFQDIVPLYENAGGHRLKNVTLRKRYQFLIRVVREAGVDGDLLDSLKAGEVEAVRKVNCMAQSISPLDARAGDAKGNRFATPKSVAQHGPVDSEPQSSSSDTLTLESRDSVDVAFQIEHSPEQLADAERPLYGGKTLALVRRSNYYEGLIDELTKQNEELEEALQARRESSPFTAADYCHFAYQVQRRRVTIDELESGLDIGEMQWEVCGDDHEDLEKAYFKVEQQSLRYRVEFEPTGGDVLNMETSKNEQGFKCITLKSERAGEAQVQVVRFQRTYQDKVLPLSKDRWAPTTVYSVMEETITYEGDGIFAEKREKSRLKEPVKQQTFTALDSANEEAVKRFVDLTFVPSCEVSPFKEAEIQARERELLDELDELRQEMFFRSADGQDGSITMSVSVEQGTLHGPRNIW